MNDAQSVIPIQVNPTQFTDRTANELRERLKGRLDATVDVQKPGIVVITSVQSEIAAGEAEAIVRDAVNGVLQTFGLDALDEGLRGIRIRVG